MLATVILAAAIVQPHGIVCNSDTNRCKITLSVGRMHQFWRMDLSCTAITPAEQARYSGVTCILDPLMERIYRSKRTCDAAVLVVKEASTDPHVQIDGCHPQWKWSPP